MTSGPEDDTLPLAPGDAKLLDLIRHARRGAGEGTQLPSVESLCAYLDGRAGEAHLEEIREALDRQPSLAGWLADLAEARERLETEAAREGFDAASPPALPAALLRRGRDALASAHGFPRRGFLGHRIREWLVGGWAVAATATAAVLLVTRTPEPPPMSRGRAVPPPVVAPAPDPPSAPPPAAPGPPVNAQEGPRFGIGFATSTGIELRVVRSPGAIDTVELEAPSKVLRITAEPPEGPDSGQVGVELRGPGGAVLARARGTLPTLSGEGRLVLYASEPFPAGRYEVRMLGEWPGAEPVPVRFPFQLRYRRSR